MAMSPPPGRRHGADRRLPYGKEVTLSAIALLLTLVLLLMVVDRMRQ
jgi:hypothetical protein